MALARFGYVEAGSFGLVNASFIALKGLLGLRTGKQANCFAIANSAGKSFRLGNIKFTPGGVQLCGTTVASHGLRGTSRQQDHSERKQAHNYVARATTSLRTDEVSELFINDIRPSERLTRDGLRLT